MLAETTLGQDEAKANEFIERFFDKPLLSRLAIDEIATIAESLKRHLDDARQVADLIASRLKIDREFKKSVKLLRKAASPSDVE